MRYLMMALALLAAPAAAQETRWDSGPWVEDLAQMRAALEAKYANLEWLAQEREVPLDRAFAQMEAALRRAGSDAAARQLFDRMIQRIGDGHVALRWPAPPGRPAASDPGGPPGPAGFCAKLGYSGRQARAGTAVALPGYRALDARPFAAGRIDSGGARIGVVRIGVFDPHGYPALCEAAVAANRIPLDRDCDESCADRVITHAFRAMTRGLAETLGRLEAEGAEVLLVDITDNGGGSEWAEAAARMLSARTLRSAPLGFVRGEHWASQWHGLAERLRYHAARAKREDRRRLLAWAAEADAAEREARTPCDRASGCSRLARAGFATGLVGDAPAGAFDGKPWGVDVFNVAQHPYRAGAWDGPVIVLVDGETWSAAEEFAAMLRDNEVATVLGGRTGGAGCGHTWGGTPTTLAHSGAMLEMPDCVRFRADGSNEVRGVIPDVLTGVRASDGAKLKAALTAASLPEAVQRARAQYSQAHRTR